MQKSHGETVEVRLEKVALLAGFLLGHLERPWGDILADSPREGPRGQQHQLPHTS